jgi:hypothetical protein
MIEIGFIDVMTASTALTAVCIALYCDTPKWRKWSPVIGIIGQPFWIWDTFMSQTWGIFFVSVVYLGVWAGGIKKYWITK